MPSISNIIASVIFSCSLVDTCIFTCSFIIKLCVLAIVSLVRDVDQGLVLSWGQRRQMGVVIGFAKLKTGSWNIGTSFGKSIELVMNVKKRVSNITCIQEIKYVGF